VVLVSYSMLIPYLMLVLQTILKTMQTVDMQKLNAYLQAVQNCIQWEICKGAHHACQFARRYACADWQGLEQPDQLADQHIFKHPGIARSRGATRDNDISLTPFS